ncbi:MAG: hypothetical protein EOP84_22770 [Verrucomicrobiaceae bacterium]|nr:MAG: hypothetical protein EOP84_22770 [Verrucomicrobiaceae bacterium]
MVVLLAFPLLGILGLLSIFIALWSGRDDALGYIFPVTQWILSFGGCVLLALAACGWWHRITRDRTKGTERFAEGEHVP